MPKVLLVGAGYVSRPLVRYLLNHEISLTVADVRPSAAAAVIGGHPLARAAILDIADQDGLHDLVRAHEVVVSLLPAPLHPIVARACLAEGRHLVTTSYISPAMRALDAEARERGLLFLNECGLDPGIDHMSAVQLIADARAAGMQVLGLHSWCGGLPAPENNDNALQYKVSWTPKGVLTAATQPARYLEDGEVIEVPGEDLFTKGRQVELPTLGALDGYPNRDSLPYRELYDLTTADSVLRGTLRYAGHCDAWLPWVRMGILSDAPLAATTRAGVVRALTEVEVADEAHLAQALHLPPDHRALAALRGLGMLDEEPLPREGMSPVDVLAEQIGARCAYREGERDMVVMQHELRVLDGGKPLTLRSTLIARGEPGGDSAMAKTVGLPAAMATRLLLSGTLQLSGVHAPVHPDVYGPLLAELRTVGVQFTEDRRP